MAAFVAPVSLSREAEIQSIDNHSLFLYLTLLKLQQDGSSFAHIYF